MLHHVELYVSDLRRSANFWGWLLGRLGYEPFQRWDVGRSWKRGPTYVVIVQAPADTVPAGYDRRRIGLNHLAFHAASREHVDDITAELNARRHRTLYMDRHPHAGGPDHYAVYFEDPDGIKIELVAPPGE